jgi:hypothetical protein
MLLFLPSQLLLLHLGCVLVGPVRAALLPCR